VSRNSGALTYQNPKGYYVCSGITLPFTQYIDYPNNAFIIIIIVVVVVVDLYHPSEG
jgi:hypothetical protein